MITPGRVVLSKSGHDKDRFYLVVKSEDGSAFIADGRRRKLDAPKRKNPRHLGLTKTSFDMSEITTDKKLRSALALFLKDAQPGEEEGG